MLPPNYCYRLRIDNNLANHFPRETENEKKQFKETKHGYLIHIYSDHAFKATVLNRAYVIFAWVGSLEIMLTVPLNWGFNDTNVIKITNISENKIFLKLSSLGICGTGWNIFLEGD